MVSIICPVYNKERYIGQTVKSIVDQTSSKWELLLIDDGSTDDSIPTAKRIANGDNRIHFYAREEYEPKKRGANTCRNIGIRLSKGPYIIFLDADDILLPHCIEQRLAVADFNPGFDLYIFNVAYAKGYDVKPYSKQIPSKEELQRISKIGDLRRYFLRKFLAFDLPWHTSAPLWDKGALVSIQGFDEDFQRLQDPEIHTKILLKGDIRLNYQMGATTYDVLHLKDEDRVVWNATQFFDKQIHAVAMFINKFSRLVKTEEGKAYLKYLRGYLIFAETLAYRYERESPSDRGAIREKLNRVYSNELTPEITGTLYKIFIKLYRITLRPSLIKLKVPGFLLSIYKYTVRTKTH